MDDFTLLQNYAKSRCQQSFATLVSRYVNLVYSAALRQLRDHHLAEEAAQAVFIVLARKAHSIRANVLLGGWLLQTTSYAARNLRRAEQRRARYERKAAKMNRLIENDDARAQAWEQIAPLLDEGIQKLPAKSRDAVILRYLEDRSSDEVARRLGISEEAARQRLSRAVELLRQYFARRGVAVPAALVAIVLAEQTVQAAPAGLAGSLACVSVSTPLSTGILTMIIFSKLKAVAAIVTGLCLFGAVTAALLQAAGPRATPTTPPAGAANANAAAAETTISGTIIDSDGRPVADAEVLLAFRDQPVYVYGETLPLEVMVTTDDGIPLATRYDRKPANQLKIITKADGKFSFTAPPSPPRVPAQPAAGNAAGKTGSVATTPPDQNWKDAPIYQIVVRSDGGFAQLFVDDLPKNGQVVLRPWGKIEGTLSISGKPKAGEMVYLSRWPRLDDKTLFSVIHDQGVRTDADGKFVFPQVAPGDAWVTRRLRAGTAAVTHFAYINLKPAETARVVLGGGRTVTAQLVQPKNSSETILWQSRINWSEGEIRSIPVHAFKPAADWYSLTASQQRARLEEWSKTEEGQAAKATMFKISFAVDPDGTVSVPDLAPGKYQMKITTTEGPDLTEPVASFEQALNVEKTANAGEALNLGTLEVKMSPRLHVGDLAPNFECKTIEGADLKLSTYKGKYVLLYLCENNMEQMLKYGESLEAIHKLYANDDRLAIITLHADPDITPIKGGAGAKALDWPQGYIGANSKIQADYHASTATIFLIGPDGKILARHLSKDSLPRAVAAALGKPK